MDLKGKTAIVTGGGTGIGAATAIRLAALGCKVALNYRRSIVEAEQTVDLIRQTYGDPEADEDQQIAFSIQADVADDEQVRAMVDHVMEAFGRLDILINNAGTTEFILAKDLDSVSAAHWQQMLSTNVVGTFQCARAAAAAMRRHGEGHIINISSIASFTAAGSSIPYCASKAAVNNMTIALARALGPEIRVNAVAPGFVDTRWTRQGLGERYDAVANRFAQNSPLKRVLTPNDIADAIISLLTGSAAVTGEILVVDGGQAHGG